MNTTPAGRYTLAAVAIGHPSASFAEPASFEIDKDHFFIDFLVEHVGYADTLGQFLEAKGNFVYGQSANKLHKGEVIIQADNVFTNHEERDDDFLNTDHHETIRFETIRQ